MDCYAELVVLAFGDVQALAFADACVDAVRLASWGAVVAGADDDLVLDDDRAVFSAQAGGPATNGAGDVEEVFGPVGAGLGFAHGRAPLLYREIYGVSVESHVYISCYVSTPHPSAFGCHLPHRGRLT